MEDKSTVGMKEQRMRRQRVNRIKTTILLTIGIWMLLSMIFCIGLAIQMFRLNHKLDKLAKDTISVQQQADVPTEDGISDGKENPSMAQAEDGDMLDREYDMEAYDIGVNGQQADNEASDDNLVQEGVRQKVYLTFDDGPSQNTTKILDILKEKNVKATFFVVGNEEEYAQELYQRIVAEGHTLGVHSYSHKYSVIYDSLEAYKNDFNQIRTYVTEITGVEPTIMRFPGGSSNQVSNIDMKECIKFINEKGVRYYDWNVVSGDATNRAYTPEELVENVRKDVERYDTSIVLMHDTSTKGTTVEALGPMIDQLRAMDVDLLPIDENTKLIQHIAADSVAD